METVKDLIAKLERFPHIQSKLDLYWGTEFCRPFLQELLTPTRSGRKGFPFAALSAIQDLLDLHDEEFPKFVPRRSPWDVDPY